MVRPTIVCGGVVEQLGLHGTDESQLHYILKQLPMFDFVCYVSWFKIHIGKVAGMLSSLHDCTCRFFIIYQLQWNLSNFRQKEVS